MDPSCPTQELPCTDTKLLRLLFANYHFLLLSCFFLFAIMCLWINYWDKMQGHWPSDAEWVWLDVTGKVWQQCDVRHQCDSSVMCDIRVTVVWCVTVCVCSRSSDSGQVQEGGECGSWREIEWGASTPVMLPSRMWTLSWEPLLLVGCWFWMASSHFPDISTCLHVNMFWLLLVFQI